MQGAQDDGATASGALRMTWGSIPAMRRHAVPPAWLIVGVLALPFGTVAAQETTPANPELPRAETEPSERPGRFKIGPFYLTPTLRIGSVGLDTNVFYTATNRQTDLTATGGPGLELVLPAGRAFRYTLGGNLDYVYFLRTESQRRLAGSAETRAAWTGSQFRAGAGETFSRTFQRPGFEVDRRVLQDQWTTVVELGIRTQGRLGLRTEAGSRRIDVAAGQQFLGADLRSSLSRDEYRGVFGLEYGLTSKTFFLVEGDYQLDRFLVDHSRNADSNRLYAGFHVDSETRLFGRAVGGVRLFRPIDPTRGQHRQVPYASVDLSYRAGPRTLLNVFYG